MSKQHTLEQKLATLENEKQKLATMMNLAQEFRTARAAFDNKLNEIVNGNPQEFNWYEFMDTVLSADNTYLDIVNEFADVALIDATQVRLQGQSD